MGGSLLSCFIRILFIQHSLSQNNDALLTFSMTADWVDIWWVQELHIWIAVIMLINNGRKTHADKSKHLSTNEAKWHSCLCFVQGNMEAFSKSVFSTNDVFLTMINLWNTEQNHLLKLWGKLFKVRWVTSVTYGSITSYFNLLKCSFKCYDKMFFLTLQQGCFYAAQKTKERRKSQLSLVLCFLWVKASFLHWLNVGLHHHRSRWKRRLCGCYI